MAAKYRSYETFAATTEQITEACLKALQEYRMPVVASDLAHGLIRARARMSVRSWGENITVAVGVDGQTEIVSECRMPTTLFDWGKNRSNVNLLFSFLRTALASAAPH